MKELSRLEKISGTIGLLLLLALLFLLTLSLWIMLPHPKVKEELKKELILLQKKEEILKKEVAIYRKEAPFCCGLIEKALLHLTPPPSSLLTLLSSSLPLSPSEKEQLKSLLEENKQTLQILMEGKEFPSSPRPPSLPQEERIKTLLQILVLSGVWDKVEGDIPQAFRKCLKAIQIADCLKADASLSSQIRRLSTILIPLPLLNSLLEEEIPPSYLKDLLSTIQKFQEETPLLISWAILKESKGFLSLMENPSHLLPHRLKIRLSPVIVHYGLTGFWERDLLYGLKKYGELLNLLKEDKPVIFKRTELLKEEMEENLKETIAQLPWKPWRLRDFHPLSSIHIPPILSFLQSWIKIESQLEMVKIKTALKIYEKEFGTSPSSLKSLTPSILPSLSPDPLTGEEYFYEKRGNDFILRPPRGYSSLSNGNAKKVLGTFP